MPHTIAENLTRLTTARTNIANAITAKGGTVTAGDGFEEFPADIATIPSGGGGFTPTAAQRAAMDSGITAPKVAQIDTNTAEIGDIFTDVVVGESKIYPVANGTYSGDGSMPYRANRIRTDHIKVYAGSTVTIHNGTLEHACCIWKCESESELGFNTVVRNDNAWVTSDEKITIKDNGYIIIIFRFPSDDNIAVSDYDGDISYIKNIALSKVDALDDDFRRQVSKNIVGYESGVMYPCVVDSGSVLTMSTADGLPIDVTSLNIIFYDENGVSISGNGYYFPKAVSKRTMTTNFTDGKTAYYAKWSKSPTREVQIEFGDVATEYAEYFPNSRASVADIYRKLDNAENLIQKTFNSSVCTVADYKTKCEEFSGLFASNTYADPPENGVVNCESFLFFTDPHLLNGNYDEQKMNDYISTIQRYYASTPTSFVVCGGDWIGNADLPTGAAFKLGYIDGFMNAKFDKYYPIVGNHDTNYQGKADAESATRTARLSQNSLHNLWYRNRSENTYYSFKGENTTFYCFDTGIENQSVAGYYLNQMKWFANALLSDNSAHIALALHIFMKTSTEWDDTNVDYIPAQIFDIAKAYNDRSSITVDDTSYDYQSATGKVEFAIAGHAHTDLNGVYKGIPVLITCSTDGHVYGTPTPTFDLVFVDYDNRNLKTVRVGNNDNRTIALS